MANDIHLEIVTPLKRYFSGQVLQVILPAWEGEEGALPDHDDKLALLRGGVCTVITVEGEKRFAIGRGFAELGADHVTLLTDSCEPAETIDRTHARNQVTEITAALDQAEWTSEEANALKARLEVEQARTEA